VGNAGADRCVTPLATAVSPFRRLCRSFCCGRALRLLGELPW
jgi:hypothetical protein